MHTIKRQSHQSTSIRYKKYICGRSRDEAALSSTIMGLLCCRGLFRKRRKKLGKLDLIYQICKIYNLVVQVSCSLMVCWLNNKIFCWWCMWLRGGIWSSYFPTILTNFNKRRICVSKCILLFIWWLLLQMLRTKRPAFPLLTKQIQLEFKSSWIWFHHYKFFLASLKWRESIVYYILQIFRPQRPCNQNPRENKLFLKIYFIHSE